MVGSERPKTCATSFRGMPRSTAASTFSLRSFDTVSCRKSRILINPHASRCQGLFYGVSPAGLSSPGSRTLQRVLGGAGELYRRYTPDRVVQREDRGVVRQARGSVESGVDGNA